MWFAYVTCSLLQANVRLDTAHIETCLVRAELRGLCQENTQNREIKSDFTKLLAWVAHRFY